MNSITAEKYASLPQGDKDRYEPDSDKPGFYRLKSYKPPAVTRTDSDIKTEQALDKVTAEQAADPDRQKYREYADEKMQERAENQEKHIHEIRDAKGNVIGYRHTDGTILDMNKQPTTMAEIQRVRQNNYTLQDILKEVGDDPEAVRQWLKDNPGYQIGPLTEEWLKNNPVGGRNESKPSGTPVQASTSDTASEETAEATADEIESNPAEKADEIAEAVGADKEEAKQIDKATKSIWRALKDGSISKESAGYFLMDAIMKQASNKYKRDANYVENLSRAIHGDTILAYDVTNDEKSKYETEILDKSLDRANQAADIESESNAQTSADLSTMQQQQQYGEAVGTEGLAQTAAVNQAQAGDTDPITLALANGDQEKAAEMLQSKIQQEIDTGKLVNLEKQLRAGTLDAAIKQAGLTNKQLEEEIRALSATIPGLEFKGDIYKSMSDLVTGISNGSFDLGSAAKAGAGLGIMAVISKFAGGF